MTTGGVVPSVAFPFCLTWTVRYQVSDATWSPTMTTRKVGVDVSFESPDATGIEASSPWYTSPFLWTRTADRRGVNQVVGWLQASHVGKIASFSHDSAS